MKALRGILFAALVVMLAGCGFEVVDTGHRGIRVTLGEVVGEPLPEGLYFYNPFTSSIKEMDVREQKLSKKTLAFTKDVQQVEVDYAVNYRPDAAHIHSIFKEVGRDYVERLLPQVVESTLKNAIGQYDAIKLVENRGNVIAQAAKSITEAAAQRRLIVTRFEVTDFGFSKEFEAATEGKVTAIQNAERAKNETIRVQEEARQTVVKAEAEAQSIKIRTQALATSPALVNYEAVRKWDGKLPQYMLGSGALPFINVK